MIKKVLAILSPRFIDFDSILSADGAMTSCSSSLADSYISSGITAKVDARMSIVFSVAGFSLRPKILSRILIPLVIGRERLRSESYFFTYNFFYSFHNYYIFYASAITNGTHFSFLF